MGTNYLLNSFNLQEVIRVLKYKREKRSPPCSPEPVALERVKRTLFGKPSREETEAFLDREWKNSQRIQRERWDFDFARGIPITGPKTRICWEVPQDAADAFEDTSAGSSEKLVTPPRNSAAAEAPLPKPRQTKLTQFMGKRRRPCEETEEAPAKKAARTDPATPQESVGPQ